RPAGLCAMDLPAARSGRPGLESRRRADTGLGRDTLRDLGLQGIGDDVLDLHPGSLVPRGPQLGAIPKRARVVADDRAVQRVETRSGEALQVVDRTGDTRGSFEVAHRHAERREGVEDERVAGDVTGV